MRPRASTLVNTLETNSCEPSSEYSTASTLVRTSAQEPHRAGPLALNPTYHPKGGLIGGVFAVTCMMIPTIAIPTRRTLALLMKGGLGGSTTLHAAVYGQKVDVAHAILELADDVDSLLVARNAGGSTPLHYAALLGCKEMCLVMLQRATDPQAFLRMINGDGETCKMTCNPGWFDRIEMGESLASLQKQQVI